MQVAFGSSVLTHKKEQQTNKIGGFDERKYLIEDQPEYFYRSYIDFTLAHQFDLTPALRCFVEHSDEFKDIFIYMSFEMDLKFATCTFNDPDQMLDDVKILLDEGLYTEADYNEKCLMHQSNYHPPPHHPPP